MPVFAELPQAQVELGKACEEGGADALIAPILSEFTANLDFEISMIKDLVSSVSIPIGLYVGVPFKEVEWEAILSTGIDFIASFPNRLPPFAAFDNRIDKVIYVPSGLSIEVYRTLSSVEGVICLVYVPNSQLKADKPFNMLDVLNLNIISKYSFKPVLFKVAYDVRVEDLPLLVKWGCSGLLLDPSGTGSDPSHYKRFIEEFKRAIKSREGPPYLPSWG
mgnify:CR=1 FL=1